MEHRRRAGGGGWNPRRMNQCSVKSGTADRIAGPSSGPGRRLVTVSAVHVLLLITISVCTTAVSLDIQVGLGGVFVPGLPTPVQLAVGPEGLPPGDAEWVLEQPVGDPWRGEAVMQYRFPFEGQLLETIFPVYDFTYPLTAKLVGMDDPSIVYAETVVNLRPIRMPEPYGILIGEWPGIDDPAVEDQEQDPDQGVIDVALSDLPDLWWGYLAIDTIWIGTPVSAIPSPIWKAIEKWVVSGGRLIIATGTSFYLIDSPELRRLLPLEEPVLIGGRLQGDLKPGVQVWAVSPQSEDEGVLIASRCYGAGVVVLVDRRAGDATADTLSVLETILDESPYRSPMEWLAEAGEINGMSLQRPSYATTALVALLVLGGFLVIVSRGRFAGGRRLIAVAVIVTMASVWSGLHVNVRNQAMTVYAEKTSIEIGGRFGISIDRLELFAAATSASTIPPAWQDRAEDAARGVPHRVAASNEEGAAVVVLPRELDGERWDASWIDGPERGLLLHADRGEKREVVFFSEEASTLEVVYTGDERLLVKNPGSALAWAVAIVDGESYSLGGVAAGESTIQLEGALAPEESRWEEWFAPIGTELEARFRLSEGAWLVAGTREWVYEQWGQATAKVSNREVTVVAAESTD